MTTVHIKIEFPEAEGNIPAHGFVEFRPTARQVLDDSVVLPNAFTVELDELGEATVELAPTTTSFVWGIREKTHAGENFYVSVPDSGTVIQYEDLIRIDPETLDPIVQVPAWNELEADIAVLQEQVDNLMAAQTPVAVRYTPVLTATGLTYTGSGTTAPAYDSHYVKNGQLVTFSIKINLSTVTNFGTGQIKLTGGLPFAPLASASSHFAAWVWVNPAQPADELNGHIQVVADHLPNSTTLDLHWIKETTAQPKPVIESLLVQGTPVTFTTSSVIYINGTYISEA